MGNIKSIKELVMELASAQLSQAHNLTPETSIIDVGDSLDRVEIVLAMEEELRIEISDETMETCVTFQHLIDAAEKARALA